MDGTFEGRWHFSFDEYYNPENERFGPLRVFNDDTLSPGAIWPLHYHEEIEVVTYCAEGEFMHEDEHGRGGVLKKGWVQHTTVGSGMYHSEINNKKDLPMRFIQMWFLPSKPGLSPHYEQKAVDKKDRANILLPLVDNTSPGALKIEQDAKVLACSLEKGHAVKYSLPDGHGMYFYVLEGRPVSLNEHKLPALAAAKVTGEPNIRIVAHGDCELLLVDVGYV